MTGQQLVQAIDPGSRSPRAREAMTKSYSPCRIGSTIRAIKSPRSAPSLSMNAMIPQSTDAAAPPARQARP
jgi:hypothetical protein